MDTKICQDCDQEKPLHSFHNDTKAGDGKKTICKDCSRLAQQNLIAAGKERLKTKPKTVLLTLAQLAKATGEKQQYLVDLARKELIPSTKVGLQYGFDKEEAMRAVAEYRVFVSERRAVSGKKARATKQAKAGKLIVPAEKANDMFDFISEVMKNQSERLTSANDDLSAMRVDVDAQLGDIQDKLFVICEYLELTDRLDNLRKINNNGDLPSKMPPPYSPDRRTT